MEIHFPTTNETFYHSRNISSTIIRRIATTFFKPYDENETVSFIYQLPIGSTFRIKDGRVFVKGQRRIKCYDCTEVSTGKKYIFQPHAEVEIIKAG